MQTRNGQNGPLVSSDLVKWLVNQGVAVALAVLVLSQIAPRLDAHERDTRALLEEVRAIRLAYLRSPAVRPPLVLPDPDSER